MCVCVCDCMILCEQADVSVHTCAVSVFFCCAVLFMLMVVPPLSVCSILHPGEDAPVEALSAI